MGWVLMTVYDRRLSRLKDKCILFQFDTDMVGVGIREFVAYIESTNYLMSLSN